MYALQAATSFVTSCALALPLLLVPEKCLSAQVSAGLLGGYSGGAGFQSHATVAGFSPRLAAALRFGIERTSLDPGDPEDARQIFINDATNGTPEKSGRVWAYRLDVIYPVSAPRRTDHRVDFFGGPRYARFTGNFRYVGGNEDFEVRGGQWGWGAGLDVGFPLTARTELAVVGGIDYFLRSTLSGHDTSYSPDGTEVNERDGHDYEDADDAVNQPGFEPRLLAGVNYHFGK